MQRIRPFQHVPSGAVHFGAGLSKTAGTIGALKKAQKIGVITDAGVRRAGLLERVLPSLEGRVAFIDDGAVPDADVAHIDAVAHKAKDAQIDAWLAVGGGSVIDTTKCAAAALAKGKSIRELEGMVKVKTALLPVVCVPTTAGTGAEATQFAVVKDHQASRKLILMDASLVPALSILDPELAVGLPKHTTAATGVDALTHAMEAMASRMWNPVATALAVQSVLMLQTALPRSLEHPDDVDARGVCLVAANLAGQAISSAMLGACHAFAHALGAKKGTAHGVANGLFLVPVLKINAEHAPTPYAYLGGLMGNASAAYAIDVIERLVHEVAGIPTRLSDVGVVEADLDDLAKLTLADVDLGMNPVALDEAAVRRVLADRL
ncbi:MAG TPA: iron-containing alcohol dehydrogenase [Myxococcota bacterium]|jgi:alcohol dehydrogenase class IV